MSTAWDKRLQQAQRNAAKQEGTTAWQNRLQQAKQNAAQQEQQAAQQAAQKEAETINQIASANPYSLEKLGASPLKSNVLPTDRATQRTTEYSSILSDLVPQQLQTGVTGLTINPNDQIFVRQAQKKQADQAAKNQISSMKKTSDVMEGLGGKTTQSNTAQQSTPAKMKDLASVNVESERSRAENAKKTQDQIKELQKVVKAYDASGIYDDKYDAYKFVLDEAQKEYDRLYSDTLSETELDSAERIQRLAQLESVQGNQDYWGKTQYDPQYGSSSTYNPITNTYETTGDLIYDYVNNRNGARGVDAANAAAYGADLAGLDLSKLKQMSADERRVYNYLYNTQGKDQAEEYLQLLSSDLNARQMDEVTTWWKDFADDHPVAASAASVAMSPMRGLSYLGQAGDMAMVNKDQEGYYRTGLDQNAGYNRFSKIPSTIRAEVSKNIEDKWGKTGSFLYQTGMSMADFITNAALSGSFLGNAPGSMAASVSEALSLSIMGTGAAADATIAAKERGLTDEQSFALGTIAGVAEILTEKVSMESLLDLTHMDRNMIGYLLKNTLAEGSEEVGSDFINLFADIIIAKDDSEWRQSIQNYMDLGMSESKSFWAAFADQAKDMAVDFLGGAISGLAMASGSAAINQTAIGIQQQRVNQIREAINQLQEQAREIEGQYDQTITETAQAEEEGNLTESEYNLQEGENAGQTSRTLTQEVVEQAQQLAAAGMDPAQISAITGVLPDENGNWSETAQTQNSMETDNGGIDNELLLSGSSERYDGTGAGRQAGFVDESAGRAAQNDSGTERRVGEIRVARYAAAQGEALSSKDLGINNGVESKTLHIIPPQTDSELSNIYDMTRYMGVETVFVDRRMQVRNHGRIQNVNGVFDAQNNRIIVCATDAKHSASALASHELYHALQAANDALTATAWTTLVSRFGEEEMNNRLMKIVEAYRGIYGISDDDLHYYQEEVIADIYGNLNRGNLDIPQELHDAVVEVIDQPRWMTPGEARGTQRSAQRYSIGETDDGEPYVIIDDDILEGVKRSEWERTALNTLKELFSNGVQVRNTNVAFDRESRRELVHSNYTHSLRARADEVWQDKLRSTRNIDEILLGAKDWVDEAPGHNRNDGKDDFARGRVLLKIGEHKYKADVLTSTDKDGVTRIHDVVKMTPESFQEKTETSAADTTSPSPGRGRHATLVSDDLRLSQNEDAVKDDEQINNSAIDNVDSEGNVLSKEQQEFFEDSVVRDDNGNLMVMYHGTPNAGFTEFRTGSYFTPNSEYADRYQNPGASSISVKRQEANRGTYKVYLNITKPFDTRNWQERQIFDQQYYRKYGNGAPLAESGLPDWTDGMDLQEFIEDMGYDYDGLILDEGAEGGYGEEVTSRGLSYVVFSPEQVKNVDNKNPTDSPDIRYSVAEEDDLDPTEEAAEEIGARFSLVTDPEEKQFLDNQDTVKVYRAMQLIDGELYPPMAAKVKDESGRAQLVEPTQIGEWYRSDEREDLIKDGKFTLNKGNGSSIVAAYNPYFHTSASPLNDQFSSAYARPNLVVVECEIPESELTSGYKAPYAKDAVGETKWHAGPVASKLKGDKARRVFLSRWAKVNRIMEDSEVADIIADTLRGEDVSIPTNVVTPSLLDELRSRGVSIEDVPGKGAEKTRFSMEEPVEETKTLIALHNLNTESLRRTLQLGGFPAPSIAIVNAKQGHTKYGQYSVVFPRSTVDPETNRKNRVYASDAWTPTASNARVEYQVNPKVAAQIENRIEELSGRIADGAYKNGSVLRSLGIDDQTEWDAEQIADRMTDREAVKAAYLADQGIAIEPVYKDKQFNQYGNEALAQFIDQVGPIRLAQIEANLIEGMTSEQALGPDADTIRKIIRDYYAELNEPMLQRRAQRRGWTEEETAEQRERVLDRSMENVSSIAIEDFAHNAWEYYEDGGRTKDTLDKLETSNRLNEAAQRVDVKAWALEQIQGLLGEAGVRNGRDTFTASGNRRSFQALHYPYTAESIVRAMYENTEGSRGQNTFGTTARSMASVASDEFRNVDQMHASESRLQRLSEEEYSARLREVDDMITDFQMSVMQNNKAHSDNTFEEGEIIGTILQENAGKTRAADVQRAFAREGYTLTMEQASEALRIYNAASELPTEYFEAKPERVVGFDEVLGVVAPEYAPEDLMKQLREAGLNVLTYEDGNEKDRLEKINSIPDVRFSVEDESKPAAGVDADDQTRAQAEAMRQQELERRLITDREQLEKYNMLRAEGVITPALERKAMIHEQAMRIREQVLMQKRRGAEQNVDTQVDLAIQVGSRENINELLRNLERRKSALQMLPKKQQNQKQITELDAGIERLKENLREKNRSARQEKRKEKEALAQSVQANESRTSLRDELLRSFSVDQSRRGEIGQMIDDFSRKIQEQGKLNREDRNRLFDSLLNSGAVRVIEDDYAAEVRDEIKGTRIYVPQEVKEEWKDDYESFRRRAWGAGIYLTNNPEDAGWDVHNAELAESFPGLFSENETDPRIALENILSAAESGKPTNMSLKDWLKMEAGGSEEGTASALRTMMEEMDAALNRFAGASKVEIDMKARSIMEEAREALAIQERADRIRENRELSELQRETMTSMRQLSKLRKKTSNATRAEIDRVIGNIDLLARHISPEGLENLQALEQEYQQRKDEMGANFIPNEYVEERLARLGKRHIDEMDANELRELGRVVSGMITSIKNAQQLIGVENARMIADVATEWQDEVDNSKGMNKNLLTKWLKADQARPSTFMQMISGWRDGAGQMLARQLESGELKQLRFMQRASGIFDPFVNAKENKEWLRKASGKNAEWITINGIEGIDAEGNAEINSISITPMMRVALYMHAQNYDNMRHIAEGGIRIPDQKLYQQGKIDESYNRGKLILLQPTDLYKILGGTPETHDLGSNMSAEEIQFAKLLKRYMDGLSKEAINETSMELDGFERAMESNYYPIQTDRRFRKTQPDAVQRDISVENTGSIANERQHAANPVELRDATDTLTWHMEQTARYHGMAVPIRNLNAVYNYQFMREGGAGARYAGSLKNTIDQKWGGDASSYLEQMMADLQGGQSTEQSTFGQISATLRGKMAGATLTLNPSVALSQTASYPAALQHLGTKALIKGLNIANRVDENLIAAYTPLLWYRAQGNITDELNRDTLKLPRGLDWISEMDRMAIKRIWAASEAWVEDNTDLTKPDSPDLDGSDPFYQRVAEKFNRIVFDTQPNYTTLQRTQLQRQGNELTKILAMYKTVPLQYYNMILEAQTRLQETNARAKAENATQADKQAYEDAKQFMVRTHSGLLISNLVYVMMKTVLMNAIVRKRDDLKDEEGNTTAASAAGGIAWALAETYAGSIIGSDVLMQAVKHIVKGDRFYGLELSSVSTINDLVEQGIDIGDYIKKILDGTAELDDGLDALHDAAAMATRLIGIPAENVEKYLLAAMKWVAPEWADKYENLFDEIEKRDLKDGTSKRDLEAQISVLMDNRTDDMQDGTIEELARLWAAGYGNVIPTAIQNTATVNGEEVTLSAKQKKTYRDAWSEPVTGNLQDLMDTDLYRSADDSQKQKMIAKLYDYAKGIAKETALGIAPDSWIQDLKDTDINIADYISEKVWLDSFEKTDEQSAKEIKLEQLMAADMDDNLRVQTYKNILASESEKAALEAVAGTDEDQTEAIRVMYQIRTATASDEMTAAEQKRNFIQDADLSAEQKAEIYYNLIADKDGKEWIDGVTAGGDSRADIVDALMNYQNASGSAEKIQTILDSNLSDEGKLELYHKITKERDDRIKTFDRAGLDLDDYLKITKEYTVINAGSATAAEKSTEFARWLDDQKFTAKQIDVVKDEMGFYSMVRASSDKYDALTDAGLSSQNAQIIFNKVNELDPEDGASQVSEVQKLEAIGKSNLSESQQIEAAKVYASDSSDRKLDVLNAYSVSVSQWAEFRRLYAEYQEQYKGQTGANQSAAKDAAMDVIGSNVSTPAGREAAAALWQTADTGWKAKNNPFDVQIGQRIYDEMHTN